MSYTREEVKAISDKVLNMAKADAVEVRFSGGERSATRYANSTITANLVEHDQEVQITVFYGQKAASTSTLCLTRRARSAGPNATAGGSALSTAR